MKILKFYSQTCIPCRNIAPKVEEFAHARVIELEDHDVATSAEVDKYGVMGVPTLIVLDEKEEIVGRATGENAIEQLLEML